MDDDFLCESPSGPSIDERAVARARAALAEIPEKDICECTEILDGFLEARARALGCARRFVRSGVYAGYQWTRSSAAPESQPATQASPEAKATAAEWGPAEVYRPFDDVEGLATAFGPETDAELTVLLASIHDDWVLALTRVLAILVDRAAQGHDAAAIDRAEDIGLLLLPRVRQLAWDRGTALAKQSAGGRKGGGRAHREARRSDTDLRRIADSAVKARVPPHQLTSYILEACGDQFGGERYLRKRLGRLGYLRSTKRN